MEPSSKSPSKLSHDTELISSDSNMASFLVPCFQNLFCTQAQLNNLINNIMQAERELDPETRRQLARENEQAQQINTLASYKAICLTTQKLAAYLKNLRNEMNNQRNPKSLSVVQQLQILANSLKFSAARNQQQKILMKMVLKRQMALNKPSIFYFSEKLSKQSSIAFQEAICLQLLKRIDPSQEICFLSQKSQLQILPLIKVMVDEELREKMEELDYLINIFNYQSQQKQFENRIPHQNNQKFIDWLLIKAKVLQKAECYSMALTVLDQALEAFKDKKQLQMINIQLQKAHLFIKLQSQAEAQQLLRKIIEVSQAIQEYETLATSYILLSECELKNNRIETSRELKTKAEQLRSGYTLSMKGKVIADSYYRVGDYLWNQAETDIQKKTILNQQLRRGLQTIGGCEQPKELLTKMEVYWNKYQEYELEEPRLQPNNKVKAINIESQYTTPELCKFLGKGQWPLLQIAALCENQIGEEGCDYLSRSKWPALQFLDLRLNPIYDEGCNYLSKGQWPALRFLNLADTYIASQGCNYLSRGQWPSLQFLDIGTNHIGPEGCKYLSQAQWPALQSLLIYSNQIGSQGCNHLSKAQWPALQSLQIGSNQIGPEGCRYLSRAQWAFLQNLDLNSNQIGSQGCNHLSRARWPALQFLKLGRNKINDQGWIYLIRAQWPALRQIILSNNNITNICFILVSSFHLSSCPTFHNIKTLKLLDNRIDSIQNLRRFDAPFLETLQLSKNRITTIRALLNIKSKSLKQLMIRQNKITQLNGLEYIQAKLLEQLDIQQSYSFIYQFSMRPVLKCQFKTKQSIIRTKANYQGQAKESLKKKYLVK